MRALVVLLVLFAPSLAYADQARAEQYFRAGAQAFKQQSFAAAAENFELAYKEAPLPEIAFSAAQSYRRQYFIEAKPTYVTRAVELYKAYLAKVKSGGRVGDASDGLAEMQRELDKLTAQGAKFEVVQKAATRIAVSVSITGEAKASMTELSAIPATDTTGVVAKLDGKPVELYVPIEVAPGDHLIEVSAPGYVPFSIKRRVIEGATDLVEAELKPKAARLAVNAEDGARVAINGRPTGSTPLPAQELAAGKYTITITRRGREPITRDVVLARGEAKALDIELERTTKRRAVPWLIGGAGALAIGSGVWTFLAVRADGKMADLDAKRLATGITDRELTSYQTQARRRDQFRTAAIGFGTAAVITAAVAAGLFFLDTPAPSEPTVVPTVTAGGGGMAVVGMF